MWQSIFIRIVRPQLRCQLDIANIIRQYIKINKNSFYSCIYVFIHAFTFLFISCYLRPPHSPQTCLAIVGNDIQSGTGNLNGPTALGYNSTHFWSSSQSTKSQWDLLVLGFMSCVNSSITALYFAWSQLLIQQTIRVFFFLSSFMFYLRNRNMTCELCHLTFAKMPLKETSRSWNWLKTLLLKNWYL